MPDRDLVARARAIRRKIRQSFESEDPIWRSAVSRYLLTEKKADEFLAAALQSEREAATSEARRAERERCLGLVRAYHDRLTMQEAIAMGDIVPSSPPVLQEETR